MFVLCVVSTWQKANCRTVKTKAHVRMEYKRSTREQKKSHRSMDIFVVCFKIKAKEHPRTIKTKQHGGRTKTEQAKDFRNKISFDDMDACFLCVCFFAVCT